MMRITLTLLAVVAVGCSASAPARFYTLDATATPTDTPRAAYGIAVGPVSIPPSVDRPQLVVQVAPNRVEIREYDRWAAPLADAIATAVARDLAALLGTPHVVAGAVANFAPTYRVSLDVQRFVSMPGKEAVIDVVWVVRGTTSATVESGRTVGRETVAGQDIDAIAAAHSHALAQVSRDIAAAIRASASPTKGSRR